MDKKDENSPSNLWTRRSNNSKLSLSMNKSDRSDSRDGHETPSSKRFGSINSKSNPFNGAGSISTSSVASPTGSGASSAFGLGSGAFGFGSAKTPKTPGSAFDFAKAAGGGSEKKDGQGSDKEEKDRRATSRKPQSSARQPSSEVEAVPDPSKELPGQWPLKHSWVIYYRPPTSKNSDYEKSIKPLCRIPTAQAFWQVYSHLKYPSALPTVSDYHLFKEGIRPVWEDEENKQGGKWTMRLKKGVADRYWEELLLALVGDQFAEASEEVCGAVVSVRSGEDVFSIWTKNDGGRNVKIRETIKRVLNLPADTSLQWRSHDESITQRNAVDQARQEKADQMHREKRRNTMNAQKAEASKREDGGDA
ncbi:IF4E-domain-containing protein [Hortaea werneckii]|uniref:Translation initiation factor eIF4E3 n=1 Tax=Hortaea werneckii TaxID=91943 RepID=A0A3M7AXY7_HORWE|nr:IF4E-domain-containing protein [Hortaea werneckii]KAI7012582.1 IF4E-domain-containing protein [Hortaea werneckii]KAI7169957.1 IF4E-domain-containing protein [Hortaea werneckii]KAI7369793.1 IF4E-domain-containing protein [Hortaea werneckii]KAI7668450.1 IF4E-domain-containing protein [Hortaea werneckii]